MNICALPAALRRVCSGSLLVALSATAAVAQQCAPVPSGAIAWYPAENHGDDLAGFYNGNLANGASHVAGKVGLGFHFDGDNDLFGTDVSAAEQRVVRTAFSYEVWAHPSTALGACPESNSSNCSGDVLRWAIFPFHGDLSAPAGELGLGAGIGLAIGTNGICVGEHAPFLVDCLARLDAPLSDWTHIVVVVENRTPRIYVNGALAHTGIASAKQFVFASWQLIGQGSTLGKFAGDLDELTIYKRALTDNEIAALFAAGTEGKCKSVCPSQRTDDAWQNATVLSNTGLRSNDASGMFGGQSANPELDSTLFADNQPDGTVHAIEWQSAAPMTLDSYGLFAFHDAIGNTQRALRHFKLQAGPLNGAYTTVYDSDIVVPYSADSRELLRCVHVRPLLSQKFRAEFTQHGPAGFSGPRVMELDAGTDLIFRDGFDVAP